MARSIVVGRDIRKPGILTEAPIYDESQIQEWIRAHLDLVPVDDMGIGAPLEVVARRVREDSEFLEILAVSANHEVVIIKVLPDFSHTDIDRVLGQLLESGSNLWNLIRETPEPQISTPGVEHLHDLSSGHGGSENDDPYRAHIPEALEPLQTGGFHYVLVAQEFPESLLCAVEYLNHVSRMNFHTVELVGFKGAGHE